MKKFQIFNKIILHISILVLLTNCESLQKNVYDIQASYFETPNNFELRLMLKNGNYINANSDEDCKDINTWDLSNVTNIDFLFVNQNLQT